MEIFVVVFFYTVTWFFFLRLECDLVLEVSCSAQRRLYVVPNSHFLILSHRVSFDTKSLKNFLK